MKYRFYLTFQLKYSNGDVAMTECSFDSSVDFVSTSDFEKVRDFAKNNCKRPNLSFDAFYLFNSFRTVLEE